VPAGLALRAAIVTAVMASPFVGCFAATVIRSNLCGEPWVWSHSCCGACGQRLQKGDLIPVFSWLMARRHCRSCRTPIPLLYPAIEFAFLGAALWASQNEDAALVLPGIFLGWVLIALFGFDVTAFVLPNALTYTLLLAGLGVSLAQSREAALESIIGAAGGGASLLLVKGCYRLLKGREGLGMGDVKLFAAAGAWLGAQGLPQTLLIASLAGLLYAGLYLRGTRKCSALQRVPFGAGLCVGLWLTWNLGLILP
jgi:leader peptidase (prepilin peptidase) / N-methyltransferase